MTQPQWTTNEDARLERLWNQCDPELSVIEIGRQCGRTKNSIVWDPLESTCRHASLSIL